AASAPCSPHTASATSKPSPTRPAPTAKPKRSSASCNGNGHTPSSTPPPATAPAPCPAGSGGTTSTDHTAASAATHPSAASHTLRGPTASPRVVRFDDRVHLPLVADSLQRMGAPVGQLDTRAG